MSYCLFVFFIFFTIFSKGRWQAFWMVNLSETKIAPRENYSDMMLILKHPVLDDCHFHVFAILN